MDFTRRPVAIPPEEEVGDVEDEEEDGDIVGYGYIGAPSHELKISATVVDDVEERVEG